MNDLDLRAALHRDADLVGDPSPDLLDQLVSRRQHQRRQRAGVFAAVAAVVVIAAGIPVGVSMVGRSHVSPATQTTASTPPVTTDAAPSTAEVAPATPTPSVPPESTLAAPPCIDRITAMTLLRPADQYGHELLDASSWIDNPAKRCAGSWAVAFPAHAGPDGVVLTHRTQIYRWVDGGWEAVDRTNQLCASREIPDSLYEAACDSN